MNTATLDITASPSLAPAPRHVVRRALGYASSRVPCQATAAHLAEGFRLFMQFLIEEETNHLCGAPRYSKRSPDRLNCRIGYHGRKFRSPVGVFSLRIPHLRVLYPRVSIVKRARRLAPQILSLLSRILEGIPLASRSRGSCLSIQNPKSKIHNQTAWISDAASSLIQAVWTLPLPDDLHSSLTSRLTPILAEWREQHSATGGHRVAAGE